MGWRGQGGPECISSSEPSGPPGAIWKHGDWAALDRHAQPWETPAPCCPKHARINKRFIGSSAGAGRRPHDRKWYCRCPPITDLIDVSKLSAPAAGGEVRKRFIKLGRWLGRTGRRLGREVLDIGAALKLLNTLPAGRKRRELSAYRRPEFTNRLLLIGKGRSADWTRSFVRAGDVWFSGERLQHGGAW